MKVHEALAEAWAQVQEASLPENLHEVAFGHALSLIARTLEPPVSSIVDAVEDVSNGTNPLAPAHSGPLLTLIGKFADESGTDVGLLEDVLYFDEDQTPHLQGPARKLGSNKADQTRRIAVVMAGAYAFALDQAEGPTAIIRDEAKRLKCFDQGNFAAHVISSTGLAATGSGRSRKVRLKNGDAGLNALKTTINEIRGLKDEG